MPHVFTSSDIRGMPAPGQFIRFSDYAEVKRAFHERSEALTRAADEAIRLTNERNALRDALSAAAAYVELYTGNGVRQQPPAWARSKDGDGFDAERIAARARHVLASIAAD